MAELVPINGLVLVEPEERQPRKTSTGILIKDPRFEGAPIVGKVYAVPPSIKDFMPGDRVIFNNPDPKGFKYADVSLFALHPNQIAAKVDKDVVIWG